MRLLSLTREIRKPESPISRFLRGTLVHIDTIEREAARHLRGTTTVRPVAPTPDYPYALVGSAIDYRVKYYFGITPLDQLPAARSARWWHGGIETSDSGTALDERVPFALYGPGQSRPEIPHVVAELLTTLTDLLRQVEPVHTRLSSDDEDELCRACCGLALVDRKMTAAFADEPYALKKLTPGATLDDLWRLIPGWVIADVRNLSYLFYDRHQALFDKRVDIPPHFLWQQRIGATADLVIEHTLVEMKTTVKRVIDPLWLYQLVAYVLLDKDDHMQIEQVGLYMVRQGAFLTWDVDDLLRRLTGNSGMTRQRLRATLESAIWAAHQVDGGVARRRGDSPAGASRRGGRPASPRSSGTRGGTRGIVRAEPSTAGQVVAENRPKEVPAMSEPIAEYEDKLKTLDSKILEVERSQEQSAMQAAAQKIARNSLTPIADETLNDVIECVHRFNAVTRELEARTEAAKQYRSRS